MEYAAALLRRPVHDVTERMFRKHFGIPPPEALWLWNAIVLAGQTVSEGELLSQRTLLFALYFVFRYPTCDEMEIFCGHEHRTLMPLIWATLWAINRSVSLVFLASAHVIGFCLPATSLW